MFNLKLTALIIVKTSKIQECRAKGNNTYQIVWRDNSDVALDGAGVRPAKT